ncbi:RdRP-domain-containing protein, partial [Mycena crocata]
MQIFMRNVAFTANEEDITLSVAQRLHRPPFPANPINFRVDLFRAARSRQAHRGIGLITVPTTDIGNKFLSLYGSGIYVENRLVKFTLSTTPVDKGLVQMVATTPWQDPTTLRIEREERARLSTNITLSKFSFGRFCRDGVFSAEASYLGTIACNVEARRIELTHRGRDVSSQQASNPHRSGSYSPVYSEASFDPEAELELDFFDEFRAASDTLSAYYASSRIIHVATLESQLQVFIQSELPPVFQRQQHAFMDLLDEPAVPEREPSFEADDFRVTSYASQGLRLVFRSHQDLGTFLQRCRALHLPRPSTVDIRIEERSIYSASKLEALQKFLRSLEFDLAFAVEKAVWDGILEPQEVISMRDSLTQLQTGTKDFETAAIFRYFLTTLGVPGLGSAPTSQKRRRRTKKQRVVSSPMVDLRAKLAEATKAYIAELYRPKGRYRSSPGIFQSYHLALTPSTQIFEGPLPDQSNNVLRRFKNTECFLRVSFQDENRSPPRRDQRLSINLLLENRYKRPLNLGLEIAGRPYEFLGYSMSGLKDYSFIFVTPFLFEGTQMNARRIRRRLGDFSKILYRPALLGARWSQAFSASDPSVTLKTNQIQYELDKTSASGSVFTDGCSSISVALSCRVWSSLRSSEKMRNPPSALQFRCGGAKGVLVQNPRLKGETVVFRPSQTKFEATIRDLDISSTSARPILLYLNRPLLEYHGTPAEIFMTLQQSAINEVQSIKNSFRQASKIYSQHGLGASFRLPSLFNNLYHQLHWSDPQTFQHQLIKTALAYATTHILREIKHRAHIIVPGSYTLIGVSDEWNCLGEGEIFATVVDERTGLNIRVEGRVLITRSPQIHPGDVQFVNAVRRPQLEHLRNVVVFACQGSRSLPSKLGGGDLDGDIYNLILEEKLFPPKDFTADPGDYIALEPKTTISPCTVSDVVDFVIDFIKSDLLGYISILHLRIADLDPEGVGCERCIELAQHASHAVDFNKRGVPVDWKALPGPPSNLRPDFLSGEGINPALEMGDVFYLSTKILGQLYRSVPVDDYQPDPSEMANQLTDGNKIETALASAGLRRLGLSLIAPSEGLLEEMRNILDEYSDQLMIIAKTHTVSKRTNAYLSEAELVSGTIQERYADHRKRREAIAAMNLQTGELTKAIRYEFRSPAYRETKDGEGDQDDWDDWDEMAEDEERRCDKFERAWAAWLVAEEALDDDPSSYGPSSFGLLALGTLLEVLKEARNSM